MVQRTHAPAVARMTPAVAVRAPVSAKPTPVVAQASTKSKAAPVAVAAAKAPAKGKAVPARRCSAKAPAKGAAPVGPRCFKAPVVVARADKTVDKRAPTKISRAEVSSAKPGKPVKLRTLGMPVLSRSGPPDGPFLSSTGEYEVCNRPEVGRSLQYSIRPRTGIGT